MRRSTSKSSVTVLRKVAGLTQQDLADLISCNRMSIQAIESGKLRLSQRMAEKLAVQTGISMKWLLANQNKIPPVCERDLERAYTREIFRMTRAEVEDPRIDPLDVVSILNNLALAYHRLDDAARQAYLANQIVQFNYALREFREELDRRWPDSKKRLKSMDVAETVLRSRVLWEEARRKKLRSKTGK